MYRPWILWPLWLLAIPAGAAPQTVSPPADFDRTNDASTWAVTAHVVGRVQLKGDILEVSVDRCTLTHSDRFDDPRSVAGIDAEITRPLGAGSWGTLRRSEPYPLSRILKTGESVALEPFILRVPIQGLEIRPSDWLTFGIQMAPLGGNPAGIIYVQVHMPLPGASASIAPSATVPEVPAAVPPGLAAPALISPPEGAVFDYFPRTLALEWAPVAGAVAYRVEWDYQYSGIWHAEAANLHGSFRTEQPFYSFDFVGGQPGRWRVWAVDAEGREGPRSPWRGFEFKR
jgi:hypothetical protein